MKKLNLNSPDLTHRNIEAISELFPSVVTEGLGNDGNPALQIDFDLLRQELSGSIVEGPQERYQLDWPGKREAALQANTPVGTTLRPNREESVDFDVTKNLFIEGDNLEALKLLQESYLGAVQMIYIDPPYNTGHDLVYDDRFTENSAEYLTRSGQASESGERLKTNSSANGRFHSDWLSMMYPRVKLAKALLADSGVMFISIDENEVAGLVKICEEVFGEANVLGALPVVMNLKGNQDAFGFAETHEFVVVCLRNRSAATLRSFPVDEEELTKEWDEDEHGLFKKADNLRATGVNAPRKKRPNLWFPIFVDRETASIYVTEDDTPQSSGHEAVWPVAPSGEELSWYWSKTKVANESFNLILTDGMNGTQFYKKQRPGLGDLPTKKPKSLLFKPSYSTSSATKELKDLLGGRLFSSPKPVPFLEDLVYLATSSDSIVLDFFAGSGTTPHAVLATNSKYGGNRRFIAIQLPEEFSDDSPARSAGYASIPQLARERIRRAGTQILKRVPDQSWARDVGFRSLFVDSSNFADLAHGPGDTGQLSLADRVGSTRADRSNEDLLFQVLLAWGVDISLPISKSTINCFEIYSVDDGALILCAKPSNEREREGEREREIPSAEIAGLQPLRAVFLDADFADDAERINVEQVFSEISPQTELRTI